MGRDQPGDPRVALSGHSGGGRRFVVLPALPKSIPAAATNIEFRYLPGFMQGGTEMTLRYTTTAADARSVLNTWDTPAPSSDKPAYLRTHPLPATFHVVVLGNGGNWNHPYDYGVAVDLTTDEVFYWMEGT